MRDLRPAQWSKLIFNATVNSVAALTGLRHDPHFAAEETPTDLGHLVHDLVDEGKAVAAAAGVELHDDPWEMNVLATRRGSAHYPSMLEDVEARRPTEIDLITGALVREAGTSRGRRSAPHCSVPAREGEGGVLVVIPTAGQQPVYRTQEGDMTMTVKKAGGARSSLLATLAAFAVLAAGSASAAGSPIVIGWAFDSKGAMAPFDNPALAAAQVEVGSGERQGRRPGPPAPRSRHRRHAGEQAGDCKIVRGEVDRLRTPT